MTTYCLTIGSYVTLIMAAKLLMYAHTKRKQRRLNEALLLSNIQKQIDSNRKTSQTTTSSIQQQGNNHPIPTKINGKYGVMHMN